MKVLFLATDMFERGGISRYTATWASVLGKVVGPENLDVLLWLDHGYRGQPVSDFRLFGPLSSNPGGASKLKVISRSLWAARKRYDLVIANHAGLALVAGAIRLLWGTPYWVACYGHEAWQPLPTSKLAALRGAELVIAISRFTAEKLEKVNGIPAGKIHLLYNAVPRQLVSSLLSSEGGERVPNLPDGEKVLLSVGDMSEAHAYKGFDTVIRALPKILRSAPNCRYLIVGQGETAQPGKTRRRRWVADHVTFAGSVPDVALVALYGPARPSSCPAAPWGRMEPRVERASDMSIWRRRWQVGRLGEPRRWSCRGCGAWENWFPC